MEVVKGDLKGDLLENKTFIDGYGTEEHAYWIQRLSTVAHHASLSQHHTAKKMSKMQPCSAHTLPCLSHPEYFSKL